jgi:hypothetical protein
MAMTTRMFIERLGEIASAMHEVPTPPELLEKWEKSFRQHKREERLDGDAADLPAVLDV